MNWGAVSAIVELLGVIAVFASLTYLAVQTRDNTRALRSSAFHDVRQSFSEVSLAIAVEPELALLVARTAYSDSELSLEEEVRYGFVLTTLLRRGESAFFQSSEGTLQMETWVGIRDTLIAVLANDYGRKWFAISSARFTNEYIEELSSALKSAT